MDEQELRGELKDQGVAQLIERLQHLQSKDHHSDDNQLEQQVIIKLLEEKQPKNCAKNLYPRF